MKFTILSSSIKMRQISIEKDMNEDDEDDLFIYYALDKLYFIGYPMHSTHSYKRLDSYWQNGEKR